VDTATVLTSLPAILAFAGFVVYEILRRQGAGDPLVTRVVDKLRAVDPSVVPHGRLSPTRVERILREHNELRQELSRQDFELLKQVLRHQFVLSALVYVLVAALCVWSLILYLRGDGSKSNSELQKNTSPRPLLSIDARDIVFESHYVPAEIDGAIADTYALKFYLQNVGSAPALSLSHDVNCVWYPLFEPTPHRRVPFPKGKSSFALAAGASATITKRVSRSYEGTSPNRDSERIRCILTVDMLDELGQRHRNQTCWMSKDWLSTPGEAAPLEPCTGRNVLVGLEDS